MTNQKYYVVRKGRVCGIFRTWDECSKQVIGFNGAQYKSFTSETDALSYLNNAESTDKTIDDYINDGYLVAYTDGSYEHSLKVFSFGVAILNNKNNIITLSGKSSDKEYLRHRNISGEILGSLNAMEFAIKNGFKKIVIFHDYEGISKWAAKEWKTETLLTKKYANKVNNYYRNLLKIEFRKVTGHSNEKYNDMVDSIAKSALTNGAEADLKILEMPALF